MPRRHRHAPRRKANGETPGRAFWSGTLTFGLVSIPVEFFAAARGRGTALKMIDPGGAPLGREYYSDKTKEPLGPDDLVRGYETGEGKLVTLSDEELGALAPELTRDIEMRVFVRRDEIPPVYYEHPYFLVPSGRSAKAYQLLGQTLRKTGRVGVGTFVMRGRQYLVAVMPEGQVLRAETLRFAGEIRSPKDAGLPEPARAAAKDVKAFARALKKLERDALDLDELSDRAAARLRGLVEKKEKAGKDLVDLGAPEAAEAEAGAGNVIDLMELLKQRIGAKPKGAKREGARKRPARAA